MTRDEIAEVLNRRDKAFATADADALAEPYARRAVLESPTSGLAEGREAIRAAYRRLTAGLGPLQVTREELLVEGSRVVAAFSATGTHQGEFFGLPPTGKPFSIRGVTVTTFDDGQIIHERRVYDFTGLLVNLGVLKTRPAR